MKKTQLLLYLAIGNLTGAVMWNPPAEAWDLATWFADSVNGIGRAITTSPGQAQTPLPVPQMEAPIGNSSSIQPCAAPPTMAAAPVQEVHTDLPKVRHYKDPRARIIMNTASGNRMKSLLNRVSNPDRYDGQFIYWQTEDGLIAVKSDGATDTFVSSWFVR